MEREMNQVRGKISEEHETFQLIQDDFGGGDAIVSISLDQIDGVREWLLDAKKVLLRLRAERDQAAAESLGGRSRES